MERQPLGIAVEGAGKRYGRQWILRGVDLDVAPGSMLAILGANGSGKSSLLRMLCAFDRPSEGRISWQWEGQQLDPMDTPLHVAYCAPDQAFISDLDVAEHVALHFELRRGLAGIDVPGALELARLETKGHVRVGNLSSGMRQRLSLTLAFATDACALFLDEPTSHLDQEGRSWYAGLVEGWRQGRTLVVASNHDQGEYPGVDATLDVSKGHYEKHINH